MIRGHVLHRKSYSRLAAVCCITLMTFLMTGCAAAAETDGTAQGSAQERDAAAADALAARYPDASVLQLDGMSATLNGQRLEEYDYTWHSDPGAVVEWYEGEEPQTEAAAYIAHDIWYYPELNTEGFTLEQYDGETEWVYRYTAEGLTDYIYATLPNHGTELPTEMMHSAEEAYNDPVLHITQPGTYILQGSWDGQIFVDLGNREETFADENAKVTLVLNGVTVQCDSAPAFLAYSAYECDNAWEEENSHTCEVDTSEAGVRVVLADGTVNSFTGANVYRLLKPEYKTDSTSVQKKSHKIDGAFYSFVSMNIDGEEAGSGILNVRSTTFEGMDTELHLTINGGYVNIYSQDDGINVNEDGVSVFTMNGGTLHMFTGLGSEGDVVDSNGYIVVNGGLIAGGTPSGADEILDSDCGTTINGGEVINIGSGRSASDPMGGRNGQGTRPDGERPDGERPELPTDRNGELPADWNNGEMPERPEDWKNGDMPNPAEEATAPVL